MNMLALATTLDEVADNLSNGTQSEDGAANVLREVAQDVRSQAESDMTDKLMLMAQLRGAVHDMNNNHPVRAMSSVRDVLNSMSPLGDNLG